ncbi:MAG: hypothetical protein ISS71_00470 [Phycisphaerae bacterium]|nr:hypothetical protein [Phycisphaerae bacterium]
MKLKKAILLFAMILTGPFVLLFCLLLLNSVNPMQWAFLTRFKVENRSGQDIRITPIGTRGDEGRKGRLPVYMIPLPALPSFRSGHYHLKNDQSITIWYDWDDVNFSEIAVRAKDGSYYEFIVDPNPLQNQYHPPTSKYFVIPNLKTLSIARPQIVDVVERPDRMGIYYVVLLAGIIIFWKFWREYKKIRILKTANSTGEAEIQD